MDALANKAPAMVAPIPPSIEVPADGNIDINAMRQMFASLEYVSNLEARLQACEGVVQQHSNNLEA